MVLLAYWLKSSYKGPQIRLLLDWIKLVLQNFNKTSDFVVKFETKFFQNLVGTKQISNEKFQRELAYERPFGSLDCRNPDLVKSKPNHKENIAYYVKYELNEFQYFELFLSKPFEIKNAPKIGQRSKSFC